MLTASSASMALSKLKSQRLILIRSI